MSDIFYKALGVFLFCFLKEMSDSLPCLCMNIVVLVACGGFLDTAVIMDSEGREKEFKVFYEGYL